MSNGQSFMYLQFLTHTVIERGFLTGQGLCRGSLGGTENEVPSRSRGCFEGVRKCPFQKRTRKGCQEETTMPPASCRTLWEQEWFSCVIEVS